MNCYIKVQFNPAQRQTNIIAKNTTASAADSKKRADIQAFMLACLLFRFLCCITELLSRPAEREPEQVPAEREPERSAEAEHTAEREPVEQVLLLLREYRNLCRRLFLRLFHYRIFCKKASLKQKARML